MTKYILALLFRLALFLPRLPTSTSFAVPTRSARWSRRARPTRRWS